MNIKNVFQADKMVASVQDRLKTVALVLFNAYVIFWVSVLLYGTFNYYYLPVAFQDHPVYFRFRVCDNGIGICSFPNANLSLIKQESQIEVFKRGQPYRIVLDIEIPESDVNKQIGMFMMEMKLYNREGKTVHSSVRSSSIHYKSILLETLETLCFAPFYLFGYMSQKQIVHVEFFPNFVEYTYNPAVGAIIEIQSHLIQLYNAKLNLFSQFSGIRYFLYYWPVTSAVIGVSWVFTLLSFIVLLSWFQFRPKSTVTDVNVLASIDMSWKRQDEKKALRSPDGMGNEDYETLGSMPEDDGDSEEDETSLLSATSSSMQESEVRQRRTVSDS